MLRPTIFRCVGLLIVTIWVYSMCSNTSNQILTTANKFKSSRKIILTENNNRKENFSLSLLDDVIVEKWQYVYEEPVSKFLVFSAYLDDRERQRFIRVIAAGKTKNPPKVLCKLYYRYANGTTVSVLVEGKHEIIQENWNLQYSARYVLCPIDTFPANVPETVTILPSAGNATNVLKIISNVIRNSSFNADDLSIEVKNIAVCVKPFYNEYNKETEIMEFIELHRILGVNHFYFYNHTLGSQVNCLFEDYKKSGIVTVLNWKLPLVSVKEIRTEGIFAALNDCLYRTMGIHTHVLFVDVDEYIIPRTTDTYKEMIESISKNPNIQKMGAFSIQNSFFYRQWPDDDGITNFNDELAASLITLRKTRRRTVLNRHKDRSKYIVRPEMIKTVGNHFIWKFLDNKFGTINVNPQDVLMHHYRVCEFGGNKCVEQQSTVDHTVYKYKPNLLNSMRKKYNKLRKKCQLLDFKI